jgi:hypothetical protein
MPSRLSARSPLSSLACAMPRCRLPGPSRATLPSRFPGSCRVAVLFSIVSLAQPSPSLAHDIEASCHASLAHARWTSATRWAHEVEKKMDEAIIISYSYSSCHSHMHLSARTSRLEHGSRCSVTPSAQWQLSKQIM